MGGTRGTNAACFQAYCGVLIEKADAWSLGLCLLKADLSRAYSSLRPSVVAESLRHFGVPEGLVRLVTAETVSQTLVPVVAGVPLKDIELKTGAPEGSPLSGTLLRAVLSHSLGAAFERWQQHGWLFTLPGDDEGRSP